MNFLKITLYLIGHHGGYDLEHDLVGDGRRGGRFLVNKLSFFLPRFTDFFPFSLFLFWFRGYIENLQYSLLLSHCSHFAHKSHQKKEQVIATAAKTNSFLVRVAFVRWKSSSSVRFASGKNSHCSAVCYFLVRYMLEDGTVRCVHSQDIF